MVAASAICWPDQYGLSQKEKENDHFGKKFEDKLGRKFPSDDVLDCSDGRAARRPLLGLYSTCQDKTAIHFASHASGLANSKVPGALRQTPSPNLLGTCTPIISPYLKELSASPASLQLSPIVTTKPRLVEDVSRSTRECASASPEGSAAAVGSVRVKIKSAHAAVPLRSKPGTRTLVKVRVRRALALQTGDEDSTCPKVLAPTRRGACSKSVGDLNLSGASLQSAACANLSRSADWPASSAACIRKRTEEGTGYEVPRKSLKHEDKSQSWQSAVDHMAQMSLQDKTRHVSFGNTTVMIGGQWV